MDAQILINNLAAARQARKAAKAALIETAKTVGECDRKDTEYGPCYREFGLPLADWCAVCRKKQPIWLEYKQASRAAGLALRQALRAAKI